MFDIPSLATSRGYLSPRVSAFLVALISLGGCIAEGEIKRRRPCPGMGELVQSAREWLMMVFQVANVMLMIGTIINLKLLVQLYLWYTLGFVVVGLLLSLMEFLINTQECGAKKSLVVFIPDVTFFFVVYACLPLVEGYKLNMGKNIICPGAEQLSKTSFWKKCKLKCTKSNTSTKCKPSTKSKPSIKSKPRAKSKPSTKSPGKGTKGSQKKSRSITSLYSGIKLEKKSK